MNSLYDNYIDWLENLKLEIEDNKLEIDNVLDELSDKEGELAELKSEEADKYMDLIQNYSSYLSSIMDGSEIASLENIEIENLYP